MLDSYRNSVFRYVWYGRVRTRITSRETMDNDWKEWDVVENICSPMIPGFMVSYDGNPLDLKGAAGKRMREEWDSFVDLLNAEGPGTGYQRLLALRENMEARQDELRKKLEKWEDRESWLQKLEGQYIAKLLVVAGVEHQSVWRGRENPIEQLDLDDSQVADEPIVEAFLEFDEDGGLEGRPDLESGWMLRVDGLFQGAESDGSRLFQVPEFGLEDERLRRDNIMIRFGFSTEELQNLGIDPENLPTSRQAIQMDPSTTWREALDQLKDKEQSVREKKGRPERTLRVLEFRLGILEDVLYRFEAFGSVERLTEEEAQDIAEESQPGRKSTLNDPEAHPSRMLKAVLEWTREDTNRGKPFRSEVQESLCGFLSKRLEEKVGYPVPQDTIKTRLRSIMDEMGVQLPHGHTNILSYFEAREEITEAMQKHDLV